MINVEKELNFDKEAYILYVTAFLIKFYIAKMARQERKMQVKNPKFEVSAVSPKQYPKNDLPQIVLVGKSNVGKSSFINTMINRKSLARTSSEPGKTRQINFYNIDEKFYFVDLPGYGYSKMSKKEQEKVGEFIEQYLKKSDKISFVIFLIDIRHSVSENDKLMYNYIISSGHNFMILANKADKIAPTKVMDTARELQKQINPIGDAIMLPFSSQKKIYSEEVWKVMLQFTVC